ncbi:MAG TPA: ABC transporter permease [Stellaceae bacterium]|nr:ABC transporter permease [Stellaceae bacterium]
MSTAAVSSKLRDPRSRLGHNAYLRIGGALTAAVLLVAVLGLIWTPYAPSAVDLLHRSAPPAAGHLFGTDQYGRDVLSRIMAGAWRSVSLGLAATALAAAVGVPLGLAGAYWRGWLDTLMMRVIDALLSIPSLIFALLIVAGLGTGHAQAIVALGIAAAPRFTRVVRGAAINAAEQDYVTAARARGETTLYIQYREILPNVWPPIVVEASIFAGFALMGGAALSFLGLGTQPPAADWGVMVRDAQRYVSQSWSPLVAPAATISLAIVGFNLLGEGLRDRLQLSERPADE